MKRRRLFAVLQTCFVLDLGLEVAPGLDVDVDVGDAGQSLQV